MTDMLTIASLRSERQETLEAFGRRIGLSKSQMHEVEKSGRASLRVALAIEALSDGRIDAGDLCEEVRLARASAHAADPIAVQHGASSGKSGDFAGSPESEAA